MTRLKSINHWSTNKASLYGAQWLKSRLKYYYSEWMINKSQTQLSENMPNEMWLATSSLSKKLKWLKIAEKSNLMMTVSKQHFKWSRKKTQQVSSDQTMCSASELISFKHNHYHIRLHIHMTQKNNWIISKICK